MQLFLDEESQSKFVAITDRNDAVMRITFKGAHAMRPVEEIPVEEFVGVKSYRAKGKRVSTYEVDTLTFFEPELPEEEQSTGPEELDTFDGEAFEQVEHSSEGEMASENEVAESVMDVVVDPEQLNLF